MAKRSSQTKQQDSSKSREESSHSSLRDNSDVECGGRAGGGSQGGAEDKKGHIMDDDQVNAFLIRMPAWLVPSLSISSRSSQPWTNPDLETFTIAEGGFSCRKVRWPSRQLAGSCSKGTLPFHSFLGSASRSMAQRCAAASVGRQKGSEHHRESP